MRLLPRFTSFAPFFFTIALAACGDGGNSTTSTGGGSGGNTTTSTGTGGELPPTRPLAVLGWNTHNFFDTVFDSSQEQVLSQADYTKKRQVIGGVIKQMNADVVVLAEVENQAILADINANELGNGYFNTTLIDGNDQRGINIGLLSKIPPDEVKSHKDEFFTKAGTNGPSYKYSRDCLEVHLTYNNRKVVLLGVHFRAKAAPDDPDKRLAEAQHTRAIADEIAAADPTAGIIILGDYNDTPGSPPVNAVAGAAPSLFTDVAEMVPPADRYSFVFQGTPELIDHQFANPLMAGMLDPASVVLKHGPGVDDDSQGASDHSPLFAIYNVR